MRTAFIVACYAAGLLALLGGVLFIPVTLGLSLLVGLVFAVLFLGLAGFANDIMETKRLTQDMHRYMMALSQARQVAQQPLGSMSPVPASRLQIQEK